MIGFVVPLRAKNRSSNWEWEIKLLERTLYSITNQTNNQFRVVVVCSDIPEYSFDDDRLTFLKYPFPFLIWSEIADYQEYACHHYDKRWAELTMDQGKKIMFGCRELIKQGCDYIMAVDADDLISNKIAAFVHNANKSENPGWFVDKGYIYLEGKNYLLSRPKAMNAINSSTNIVRSDLIPMPSAESCSLWDNNFFAAHAYLPERIFIASKQTLKPLPFFGTIYSANGNNWSQIYSIMNRSNFTMLVKKIFYRRIISRKIKKTFNFYRL